VGINPKLFKYYQKSVIIKSIVSRLFCRGIMLTFNPGWDQSRNTLESFYDVRDSFKEFESQGINISPGDKSIHGESASFAYFYKNPDGI